MINEALETFQQPRDLGKMETLKGLKEEAQRIVFIKAILSEIKKSSNSIVEGLEEGLTVNNLDEISTAIHNELNENTKILVSALLMIKNSQQKSIKELGDITEATAKAIVKGFELLKPSDTVFVKNLSDIIVPEQLNVKNLKELEPYFKTLENAIKSLVLDLPTPQVTVNVPDVHVEVPETQINVPEVNFDEINGILDEGLKKLRQNKMANPIFVRMTDLERLLDKLDEIRESSRNVMLGFPGALRIQNATGGIVDFNQIGAQVPTIVGSGKTNVVTAGTAVILAASTTIKSVTIKAKSSNTGFIYVGTSTVTSSNGFDLKAGDSISYNISNLNTIYINSSVSGEGVSYSWVN